MQANKVSVNVTAWHKIELNFIFFSPNWITWKKIIEVRLSWLRTQWHEQHHQMLASILYSSSSVRVGHRGKHTTSIRSVMNMNCAASYTSCARDHCSLHMLTGHQTQTGVLNVGRKVCNWNARFGQMNTNWGKRINKFYITFRIFKVCIGNGHWENQLLKIECGACDWRNFKWKRRKWAAFRNARWIHTWCQRLHQCLHMSDFQTNKSISISQKCETVNTHRNMHGYCVCWRVYAAPINQNWSPTNSRTVSESTGTQSYGSFVSSECTRNRCKTSACGGTVVHTMPIRMTFKRMNLTTLNIEQWKLNNV